MFTAISAYIKKLDRPQVRDPRLRGKRHFPAAPLPPPSEGAASQGSTDNLHLSTDDLNRRNLRRGCGREKMEPQHSSHLADRDSGPEV